MASEAGPGGRTAEGRRGLPPDRQRALLAVPAAVAALGADTTRLRLTAITRQRPAGAWHELAPLITHRIA